MDTYKYMEIDSRSPGMIALKEESWELLRVIQLEEKLHTMSIPYSISVYRIHTTKP